MLGLKQVQRKQLFCENKWDLGNNKKTLESQPLLLSSSYKLVESDTHK